MGHCIYACDILAWQVHRCSVGIDSLLNRMAKQRSVVLWGERSFEGTESIGLNIDSTRNPALTWLICSQT